MKYTREKIEQLTKMYNGGEGTSVEEIAETLETTPRSVVAKLSSLGVYKPKRYLNKRGEPPRKKDELIDDLALVLGCDPFKLDSLEKVNKSVILYLIDRYKALTPKEE
jgi:hypothetical protein